jgi:hypothetical protein
MSLGTKDFWLPWGDEFRKDVHGRPEAARPAKSYGSKVDVCWAGNQLSVPIHASADRVAGTIRDATGRKRDLFNRPAPHRRANKPRSQVLRNHRVIVITR